MMSSPKTGKDKCDSVRLMLSCICSRERQVAPSEGARAVSMPGCLPCTSGDEKRRVCLGEEGTLQCLLGAACSTGDQRSLVLERFSVMLPIDSTSYRERRDGKTMGG